MEPYETYLNISSRAKRLLHIHDGLINIRRKGIRKDWKRNFCKIMHWPISSDIERIDSKEAIIVLRAGAKLKREDFEKEIIEDLLRSAITFGVSALDRYVHERVVKNIIAALSGGELSKHQRNLEIPAHLALKSVRKMSKTKGKGKNVRPANDIRNEIQEVLHARPYQGWLQIVNAFKLIGISELKDKIGKYYSSSEKQEIESTLDNIVIRRNYIVHEGDLKRHQRGGNIKMHELSRKEVEDSLNFIDKLVRNLDKFR